MSTHPRPASLVTLIASGAGMALYLGLRPYGDASHDPRQMAAAFASWRWITAHVCGAVALVCAAIWASAQGRLARVGLVGAALVLPYYGAESFALHEIGRAHLAGDAGAIDLVEKIRNNPVALTTFGLGLLLLAVAGIAAAVAWQRMHLGWRRFAAWPVGVLLALVLPQYYLPPVGRVAFGVVFLVAAMVAAGASRTPGATRR